VPHLCRICGGGICGGGICGAFVAARRALYRALMGSDHEAEIRASVGAHQDLGSGYDDAVAEGLVERIGAEIDKRIEAQLRRYGTPLGPPVPPSGVPGASDTPASPGPAEPTESAVPQAYPTPAAYPPPGYPPGVYPGYPGYPGHPGYQAPMLAPGYQASVPGPRPTSRSVGQHSVAMTVIALGSMTLGVAATAIVAHANSGGQAVMVLLIWVAIAIVNIAYARRC
jgi:hypothetical protein